MMLLLYGGSNLNLRHNLFAGWQSFLRSSGCLLTTVLGSWGN
jgi:hypothetical protein